jgi:hypothetical protein
MMYIMHNTSITPFATISYDTINTEHSRLYHHKHIAKLVYSLSVPAFRRSRRFQNARTLSALFSK